MTHPLSVLALVLVGGMLLRMPIGFSMLASGVAYLLARGQDIGLVAEQVGNGLYNSYVLLAVPRFIFAAFWWAACPVVWRRSMCWSA